MSCILLKSLMNGEDKGSFMYIPKILLIWRCDASQTKASVTDYWRLQPLLQVFLRSLPNMKSSLFCSITSCSPLKFNQYIGGSCCIHLQGWKVKGTRNLHQAGWKFCWPSTDYMNFISEDRTLPNHCCGNFKSYIFLMWFMCGTKL